MWVRVFGCAARKIAGGGALKRTAWATAVVHVNAGSAGGERLRGFEELQGVGRTRPTTQAWPYSGSRAL